MNSSGQSESCFQIQRSQNSVGLNLEADECMQGIKMLVLWRPRVKNVLTTIKVFPRKMQLIAPSLVELGDKKVLWSRISYLFVVHVTSVHSSGLVWRVFAAICLWFEEQKLQSGNWFEFGCVRKISHRSDCRWHWVNWNCKMCVHDMFLVADSRGQLLTFCVDWPCGFVSCYAASGIFCILGSSHCNIFQFWRSGGPVSTVRSFPVLPRCSSCRQVAGSFTTVVFCSFVKPTQAHHSVPTTNHCTDSLCDKQPDARKLWAQTAPDKRRAICIKNGTSIPPFQIFYVQLLLWQLCKFGVPFVTTQENTSLFPSCCLERVLSVHEWRVVGFLFWSSIIVTSSIDSKFLETWINFTLVVILAMLGAWHYSCLWALGRAGSRVLPRQSKGVNVHVLVLYQGGKNPSQFSPIPLQWLPFWNLRSTYWLLCGVRHKSNSRDGNKFHCNWFWNLSAVVLTISPVRVMSQKDLWHVVTIVPNCPSSTEAQPWRFTNEKCVHALLCYNGVVFAVNKCIET